MDISESDQENNRNMITSSVQRKLRYRELLNRVEGIEESEDLGIETVKEIGEIIRQVNIIEAENNIQDRYQFAEETLLDSMVLSSSSGVLVKCIKNVDINGSNYTGSEFVANIAEFCRLRDNSLKLTSLLSNAQKIITKVPAYKFVFGSYDVDNLPQPKEKKPRQKRQKEEFQRKVPEKVTELDKEEAGIEETVKVLYDVLTQCYEQNNKQPVNYFDYVIDTSSFPNTVDNIFYCSFLIRDGRAHIDIDGRGVPFIKPIHKAQLKNFRDNGGINTQIISVISKPKWKTFTKAGYIQKYKSRV